jgi:hypothetical protein
MDRDRGRVSARFFGPVRASGRHHVRANRSGAMFTRLFMFTGIVKLIVMALSACGVVVSLIIWIAAALTPTSPSSLTAADP